MKAFSLFITAILFLPFANAQSYLENSEEISKHSETVMNLLKVYDYQNAFIELGKYYPLSVKEMDQLESQTISQFEMIAPRFGDVIGMDFIKADTLNDFAIRETYVLRFERHLLRILFIYYRNDEGWLLNNFKFDDLINELFD